MSESSDKFRTPLFLTKKKKKKIKPNKFTIIYWMTPKMDKKNITQHGSINNHRYRRPGTDEGHLFSWPEIIFYLIPFHLFVQLNKFQCLSPSKYFVISRCPRTTKKKWILRRVRFLVLHWCSWWYIADGRGTTIDKFCISDIQQKNSFQLYRWYNLYCCNNVLDGTSESPEELHFFNKNSSTTK